MIICIFFSGDIIKNKGFLLGKLIAHRGIHYRYIENTIDAFRSAILRNYIIELDVRLTIDNIVIVYHDSNLYRLTGIDKDIKDCTYEYVKSLFNVPTLDEVLKLVRGRVPIIVELKSNEKGYVLEKLVARTLDNYKGKFTIQSFNPLTLFWFKINRNKYIRGYLVNNIFSKNFLIRLLLNNKVLSAFLKPDYIAVNIKYIDNNKIIRLRNRYIIIGYTINSKYEYNKYKEYGDNFICNIGKEPFNRLWIDKNQETDPLRTVSQKE